MENKLENNKITEIIRQAINKENYFTARVLASKPFQISHVEKIVSENDGVIIGAAVIFGDVDEAVSKAIRGEKSHNFIVVLNEEGINTLHEFFERRKLEKKNETLTTAQDTDTKIKEVIKKHKPEEKEENVQIILKFVKDAEKTDIEGLRTKMGEVYKLGYNHGETTDIFMANPILKVNKNTFVIKRDVKEED